MRLEECTAARASNYTTTHLRVVHTATHLRVVHTATHLRVVHTTTHLRVVQRGRDDRVQAAQLRRSRLVGRLSGGVQLALRAQLEEQAVGGELGAAGAADLELGDGAATVLGGGSGALVRALSQFWNQA